MQYFLNFLKWYNNKDVVLTLEAMQKKIESYNNKGIDMLKLGCTLPKLAEICLHNTTDSKLYPLKRRIKSGLKSYGKIWLAVLLLSLHVKL